MFQQKYNQDKPTEFKKLKTLILYRVYPKK